MQFISATLNAIKKGFSIILEFINILKNYIILKALRKQSSWIILKHITMLVI